MLEYGITVIKLNKIGWKSINLSQIEKNHKNNYNIMHS